MNSWTELQFANCSVNSPIRIHVFRTKLPGGVVVRALDFRLKRSRVRISAVPLSANNQQITFNLQLPRNDSLNDELCHKNKLKASQYSQTESQSASQASTCIVEYYTNHIITRMSIQTAGLAFGGNSVCSYRVRGVDGSCANTIRYEMLF